MNHSGHDITSAERVFKPEVIYCLTEGNVRLDELDRIKYNMVQKLKEGDFDPHVDKVLLCGNIVLNAVITAILFGYFKVHAVDLLIWDGRKRNYLLRSLNMEGIDLPTVFNNTVPRETP